MRGTAARYTRYSNGKCEVGVNLPGAEHMGLEELQRFRSVLLGEGGVKFSIMADLGDNEIVEKGDLVPDPARLAHTPPA